MSTKICCHCKQELPLTAFNKASQRKDGLQSRCKTCHGIHNKRHYRENQALYQERAVVDRERNMAWYREYKRTLSCENCGEDKPWRLTHHHIDPTTKIENVGTMVSRRQPQETVVAEMAKCIVLCHNCHSDIHLKPHYV